MTPLLLAPHNDDETLFASFICLRENPHVIVVLRSQVQEDRFGISADQRERETDLAMSELYCTWEQWPTLDAEPDWEEVDRRLVTFRNFFAPSHVYVPAWEVNGHAHHNIVGDLARSVFGLENITHYLTYTTAGKSTWGVPVEYEPEWVARKMSALTCYRSQASLANCAEHFLRDQHEYVAA